MLVRAFGVDDAGLKGFWQQGRKIAIAEAASLRLKSFGDATISYIFINLTSIQRVDVADCLAE
jgi:hypothetical protein